MISLNEKLKRVRDVLSLLEVDVYHYWRPDMSAPFAVWQEDGEVDAFHSDNAKQEQEIHGTLDYFTKEEFDQTVDNIQEALEALHPGAWQLNAVLYEEETNLIHYAWEFTVA